MLLNLDCVTILNMPHSEQLLLQKIQVILAEKRTLFSILRTGMAVITLPLTVIVFMVATREYHSVLNYIWISIFLIAALLTISFSGIFITLQSFKKIKKLNHLIMEIERENKDIDKIMV